MYGKLSSVKKMNYAELVRLRRDRPIVQKRPNDAQNYACTYRIIPLSLTMSYGTLDVYTTLPQDIPSSKCAWCKLPI